MSLEAAKKELEKAGLFDKDSDYDGMLGHAVMKLMEVHLKEGHSGYSNGAAVNIFSRLATGKTLSPITNDPAEWMDVVGASEGQEPMWQNRRDSTNFSNDGGKTYYCIDEEGRPVKTAVDYKK